LKFLNLHVSAGLKRVFIRQSDTAGQFYIWCTLFRFSINWERN